MSESLIVVRAPFDIAEIGAREGDVLSFNRETGHLCIGRSLDGHPTAMKVFRQLLCSSQQPASHPGAVSVRARWGAEN